MLCKCFFGLVDFFLFNSLVRGGVKSEVSFGDFLSLVSICVFFSKSILPPSDSWRREAKAELGHFQPHSFSLPFCPGHFHCCHDDDDEHQRHYDHQQHNSTQVSDGQFVASSPDEKVLKCCWVNTFSASLSQSNNNQFVKRQSLSSAASPE